MNHRINRIQTNNSVRSHPLERKLNELQNEWGLTNTPKTNSYTLTYTPREIRTGIHEDTEEFRTKTKTKTKNSFTLFSALREIVKQRET